jgi:hypothetical protein
MNWDAIAATAELLGATGVILSLVYLAAQVRQGATARRMGRCRRSLNLEEGAGAVTLMGNGPRRWGQGERVLSLIQLLAASSFSAVPMSNQGCPVTSTGWMIHPALASSR